MRLFYGDIEFLTGQPAAIITLHNVQGDWSGSSRIDLPRCPKKLLRSRLYEAGYRVASASATMKSGRLERFREVGSPSLVRVS